MKRWYGETASRAATGSGDSSTACPRLNRDSAKRRETMSVGSAATRPPSTSRCSAHWRKRVCLQRAVIEIKVGSSEGGNKSNPGSHHPIRSGAVRSYKATGHRHMAEVRLALGDDFPIHFSVTAIEMVRGAHLLAHCYLREPQVERDIWRLYRRQYRDEPFIRLVSAKTGLHRLPEPRVVAGTNYCDIGFELDEDGAHLVVIAALDNLGKGASGSAVQSMNLMLGQDEKTGLEFPGLYP